MKRFLPLLILTGLVFGQDVLTTLSGKEYKGKWIMNTEDKVRFLSEGNTVPTDIPKASIIKIELSDGTRIDINEDTTPEAIRLKELKEKCNENSTKEVMVLPLLNDYYGLSEDIVNYLDKACYSIVNNIKGLEYFSKQGKELAVINDYDLMTLANTKQLDLIVYGYTYKVEEPFKYVADPARLSAYSPESDPLLKGDITAKYYDLDGGVRWDDILTDAIVSYTRKSMKGTESERRMKYEYEAGTYVYSTVFIINVESGEKTYWFKNKRLFKL